MGQAPRGLTAREHYKEQLCVGILSHYAHIAQKRTQNGMIETLTETAYKISSDYIQIIFKPDSGGTNEPFSIYALKDCTLEFWSVVPYAPNDTIAKTYYVKKAFKANEMIFGSGNQFSVHRAFSAVITVY